MANGRCGLHGGQSTGPRTAEGLARCRMANDDSADIASILGLHLEGPFISPRRLGVHPALMLEPAGENLDRVLALEQLRLLTLAP